MLEKVLGLSWEYHMLRRVLLIYPPVARVPRGVHRPSDLGDQMVTPYGLLTIAAELRRAGFQADVVNLSQLPWEEALAAIQQRPADLFGLSCYTFHRHVTAALGTDIKSRFPESHLTVGGPHASALAVEWLAHYPAFDSVVVGEGEATVVELAECLRDGRSWHGLAGTAYRDEEGVHLGPRREVWADLDGLAKPWEHFDYGFVITSRGCPGKCTFCSSPKLWGGPIRFRSAESVLEELEELVVGRGHRFLGIKDDTFTVHRKRVLAICEGIVARGLNFRWMCDTRADCIDPEVLAAMRRAGCVKVNIGIESANPQILENLRKRLDLDQARQATADAREVGMDVRFYLIVGSRGETPATIRESLAFVEAARPTHFFVHGLAIYPGTEEFEHAQRTGRISTEDYFTGREDCCELVNLGEQSPAMQQALAQVRPLMHGQELTHAPHTLAERQQILARHGDMWLSYADLAIAYALEWRLGEAEQVLREAMVGLGRETPELWHYLACVRFAQQDFVAAQDFFYRALQATPNDSLLLSNWQMLRNAGPIDYQRQGELAVNLFENLRSLQLLYVPSGARELTLPLSSTSSC